MLLIDQGYQCNITALFEPIRSNNAITEAFKENGRQDVKIDYISQT